MIQSRWSKVLGILPLVGALVGLAGCNNQNVDPETADVAASELGAAPQQEKGGKPEKMRGKHGKHGPAFLLGAALRQLDLTDAQKATIEAEMEALRGSMEERGEGREAHHEALAAAVRSGRIDEAALLAQMKKDAPAPDMAKLAKAVQTLHDTLTAAQRKELVAAVSAKMEKHAGHEGGPAHEGRGDKGDRGDKGARGAGMRGPLGHMLRDIELTDAQREKVREAFEKMAPSDADREAMKAQHEAFRASMKERLETFATDRFDANAFVAMPKDGAKGGPEGKAGHMVKALAVVVPILDAAQREELARRIEQGPPAGKHGGHDRGRQHAE